MIRPANDHNVVMRTCLVYATVFAWSGLNQPYFPIWLAEHGITEPQIAIILSLPLFMRLLITPVLGRIADASPDRTRLVRIMTVAGFAMSLVLWRATGFWPILICYVLMMIPLQNVSPVFDASALDLVRRGIVRDFGRMRLFGSAGYAVAGLAGGYILGFGGPSSVFIAFITAVFCLMLASFSLPATPVTVRPEAREEKGMLKRPAVLAMTLASALVLASQTTFNSFGSLHLRGLGVPDHLIGLFWAIATSSEILMFWAGPVLSRYLGPVGVVVLAASGAVVRWSLMSTDPGIGLTILLQMLHAATFSCAHMGLMSFFAVAVSSHRGASSQAGFVTINSVLTGLVTLAMGPIYKNVGAGAYLAAAALPAMALIVLFVFRKAIAAELAARSDVVDRGSQGR